jgi:hypothetical protein
MADEKPIVVAERRAGQRVPASIIVRLRRTNGDDQRTMTATIVDLSVSGARLVAPTKLGLVIGDELELVHRGVRAVAVIRRFDVGGIRGRAFYGVEFIECDDAFRGLIFRVVSSATQRR